MHFTSNTLAQAFISSHLSDFNNLPNYLMIISFSLIFFSLPAARMIQLKGNLNVSLESLQQFHILFNVKARVVIITCQALPDLNSGTCLTLTFYFSLMPLKLALPPCHSMKPASTDLPQGLCTCPLWLEALPQDSQCLSGICSKTPCSSSLKFYMACTLLTLCSYCILNQLLFHV